MIVVLEYTVPVKDHRANTVSTDMGVGVDELHLGVFGQYFGHNRPQKTSFLVILRALDIAGERWFAPKREIAHTQSRVEAWLHNGQEIVDAFASDGEFLQRMVQPRFE